MKNNERLPLPEYGQLLPQEVADPRQWSHNKTWAGIVSPFYNGAGVRVGVIDTGCDASHPDLTGRIIGQYNIIDGNSDVADVVGHGTNVAGMAGGHISIAPLAQLGIFKVSGEADGSADTRDIAAAITAAMEAGFHVLNVSYDISSSQVIKDAAKEFADSGGILVAAGGNSGSSHFHPADSNIIAVGATDRYDNKPSWTETGQHIDIYAPGVQVFTTSVGGAYNTVSGTSFSSPFIAAACAIIKGIRPEYHVAEVYGCLRKFNAERVNVAYAAYAAFINRPEM